MCPMWLLQIPHPPRRLQTTRVKVLKCGIRLRHLHIPRCCYSVSQMLATHQIRGYWTEVTLFPQDLSQISLHPTSNKPCSDCGGEKTKTSFVPFQYETQHWKWRKPSFLHNAFSYPPTDCRSLYNILTEFEGKVIHPLNTFPLFNNPANQNTHYFY